jgi:uncharacterized membrane protein YhiD involved in acid resistance
VIDVASSEVLHILVATFGGAVIGLERQWSGHATGPKARFAGVRTFTLIGELSGVAGWLSASRADSGCAGAGLGHLALASGMVALTSLKGPFGPLGGVHPRALWALVLLFPA